MTIEERLAAMERRIAELEARLGMQEIRPLPTYPVQPFRPYGAPSDCGCPPVGICMSAACPRMRRAVSNLTAAGGDHA